MAELIIEVRPFLFSLSKICILKNSQKITEKVFWSLFKQLFSVTNIVITAFR